MFLSHLASNWTTLILKKSYCCPFNVSLNTLPFKAWFGFHTNPIQVKNAFLGSFGFKRRFSIKQKGFTVHKRPFLKRKNCAYRAL